jgi:hypothetical protein
MRRTYCVICGGGGLCEHGKKFSKCKECGSTTFCDHGIMRRLCKNCHGKGVCPHGRIIDICKECHGCNICPHEKQRKQCQICDPCGYLRAIVTGRVKKALLQNKTEHTIDYLGCDIATLKKHLEDQFEKGMTWDNHGDNRGEWAIDHIIPIKWDHPTLDEVKQRLHYINTQPLWSTENMSKHNRLRQEDETKILHIWNQLTPELKQQWITKKGIPKPKIKLVLKKSL